MRHSRRRSKRKMKFMKQAISACLLFAFIGLVFAIAVPSTKNNDQITRTKRSDTLAYEHDAHRHSKKTKIEKKKRSSENISTVAIAARDRSSHFVDAYELKDIPSTLATTQKLEDLTTVGATLAYREHKDDLLIDSLGGSASANNAQDNSFLNQRRAKPRTSQYSTPKTKRNSAPRTQSYPTFRSSSPSVAPLPSARNDVPSPRKPAAPAIPTSKPAVAPQQDTPPVTPKAKPIDEQSGGSPDTDVPPNEGPIADNNRPTTPAGESGSEPALTPELPDSKKPSDNQSPKEKKPTLIAGTDPFIGDLIADEGITVSPGYSPGHKIIDGDFTLQAGGLLEMEFAGTDTALFDVLDVKGDAIFEAGSIHFKFIYDFEPTINDSFDFLFADTISGFAMDDPDRLAISIFGLPIGLELAVDEGQTNDGRSKLTLRVISGITGLQPITVPEPATLALICLGLAGMAYRRKAKAT